jgi:hypothetical protein
MARLKTELAQKRQEFAYKAFQAIPPATIEEVQVKLKNDSALGGIEMGTGPIYKIRKLAKTGQPLPVIEVKPKKEKKASKPQVVTAEPVITQGPENSVVAYAKKVIYRLLKRY